MVNDSAPVFIYALTDPREADDLRAIRYVGFTTRTLARRLCLHLSEARNGPPRYHRLRWLRQLLAAGSQPGIVILDMTTREEAAARERYWIALCRRMGCRLTNSTDGGEGILNPSPEMRAKLSYAARHRSEETRAKLSAALTGRIHSPETKAKLSAARKGQHLPPHTPEARRKISQALVGNQHFLGHHHTDETKAKQAAAKIGNASRRGMVHSEATKEKMSAKARGERSSSAKLSWEQVREIRRRHAAGGITQTALAREFGISIATLCVMLQGKTWIEDNP